MEHLTSIIGLLGNEPVGVTAGLGAAALMVTLWLRLQSGGVEKITSISKLQAEHVEDLLTQNRELAHDLHLLRKEMAAALTEISSLRDEISRVRNRLSLYETHCVDCTKRPSGMIP